MSKIALATAVLALTAAVPLAMGHAEGATQLVPAAYPPWGLTTPTTETKPAPTPAGTLATQPPPAPAEADTTTSIQGGATPLQGTTTVIQAVSLRSGPNTGSPVIGTLQPGMAVQVLASANHGWMQVETQAGSGWAYSSYLAPVGSTVVVQHPEPPPGFVAR
jgi:uncharacterized protein YgiM (DUF1202 family)